MKKILSRKVFALCVVDVARSGLFEHENYQKRNRLQSLFKY